MPVYRTTFAVDAAAARVWEVLTALERYPEWNPQIRGYAAASGQGSGSTCSLRSPADHQ